MKITPGDIFEVELKDRKKYFQFIYKDVEYMAGHLIRMFEHEVKADEVADLNEIIKSPIITYTYTRVIEGCKDGFWKKIGNKPIEENFEAPTFRQTNDDYSRNPKSNNWFIWKHEFSNKQKIGALTDRYRKLPISAIYPVSAIVRWIDTGHHGFIEVE